MNLSKSGIDHHSMGEQSDHSEERSPAQSMHEDEDILSDRNESDNEDRDEKDDSKLRIIKNLNQNFY